MTRAANTTGIDFALAGGTSLGGIVSATDGFVLPGSRVSIFNPSGGLTSRATAGAFGRFTTTLPAGSYRAVRRAPRLCAGALRERAVCAGPVRRHDGRSHCARRLASRVSQLRSRCVCRARDFAAAAGDRRRRGGVPADPWRRWRHAPGASMSCPASCLRGLTLDGSTGVLAGNPTAQGSYAVTVGSTDANGCGGSRDYVIDVQPCAFVLDSQSASRGPAASRGSSKFPSPAVSGRCGQTRPGCR